MSWYGDPDALDAAARQLTADSQAVRARSRAVAASVAAMRWEGTAAAAFRRTVEEDADALHRAARELEQAAAALREHVAEVRARLARIRALEDAVTGWFDDRLRSLRAGPQAVADAVTPGHLPDPGDMAWLEVGDYLRSRGVRL